MCTYILHFCDNLGYMSKTMPKSTQEEKYRCIIVSSGGSHASLQMPTELQSNTLDPRSPLSFRLG